MNPVYRHRLFTHEDIFITKFPVDLNVTTPIPIGSGGGREDSNTKTDAIGGGKNKSKAAVGAHVNTNTAPSQLAVLATPEDISDHKHTLTAKVGGVELKYTVTYVCFNLSAYLSILLGTGHSLTDRYPRTLWAVGWRVRVIRCMALWNPESLPLNRMSRTHSNTC